MSLASGTTVLSFIGRDELPFDDPSKTDLITSWCWRRGPGFGAFADTPCDNVNKYVSNESKL